MLRCFFFFQAEDGIRDLTVTGVQTCALPISAAGGARRMVSRASPGVDGLKQEPTVASCCGDWWCARPSLECNRVARCVDLVASRTLECCPRATNHCDPRSGGTTR